MIIVVDEESMDRMRVLKWDELVDEKGIKKWDNEWKRKTKKEKERIDLDDYVIVLSCLCVRWW